MSYNKFCFLFDRSAWQMLWILFLLTGETNNIEKQNPLQAANVGVLGL
jgi:hypothetical protein